MAINKFLFFYVLLFLSFSFASGGGWISSGGEIFKNGKNPWFVKNTSDVKYCVEFSGEEFSISKEDSLKLIEQALSYWKAELDGASALDIANLPGPQSVAFVDLATQNFHFQTNCTADADLIFKFGYKTLDATEITYLKDPGKFLGVTIRKDYDEQQLKGKGIIYISGDKGTNAYSSLSGEFVSEAWRYPKLLEYAIIHELGHVFGLPHSGSGLMSEEFLDQLLIKKIAAMYVNLPIMPFIKAVTIAEICSDPLLPSSSQNFVADFFSLSFKDDCLRIEVNTNKREFSILTKKNGSQDAWKKIGTLFIDRNEFIDFSLKPAVMLQLSDQRQVFKSNPTSFMIGPVFQNYKVDGHITFGNSMKPYSVQVDLSPDSLVIYGNHNNKVRQLVSYGSPFLFNLVKPF